MAGTSTSRVGVGKRGSHEASDFYARFRPPELSDDDRVAGGIDLGCSSRAAGGRRAEGLPHQATLTNDEFMEATLDLWRIPPESAPRVGHPAPFPVELPLRLIELYTYEGDLVLERAGFRVTARDRRLPGAGLAAARVVLLTSHLAASGTSADQALRAVGPARFFDAVELLSDAGQARLAAYATGRSRPHSGFWTEHDLSTR